MPAPRRLSLPLTFCPFLFLRLSPSILSPFSRTLFSPPYPKVDIIDSSFTDNYVSDADTWSGYAYDGIPAGGGLYIYGEASISLRASLFSGNGAKYGGGAKLTGNHTVTVEECLFDENLSNNEGAGMSVSVSQKEQHSFVCGRSFGRLVRRCSFGA